MPGYRHRYMYYATGLPGWMRFGFSPGWMGASPTGMGPTASYLLTGRWPTPQAQAWWQAMQAGQVPYPMFGGGMPYMTAGFYPGGQTPGMTPQPTEKQELELLQSQSETLREQLNQINQRIKELEKEK